MHPQVHYKSQCDFTYLFCCKCTYDSHCVYKAFFVLDAIYFGGWGIQVFFYIGGQYGLNGLIGLPFAVIFFVLCGLAIRNLCKLNTDLQNKEIQQRSDLYQKWRWGGIGALGAAGIILAIVYYYSVKNSYEKAGYPEDEARSYGTARLINTLFSYTISIVLLLGYRPSLLDSTKMLTMSTSGGATLGSMNAGRPFELQQPIYSQQPQFVPFGGQGRMIGGPAQPMYMPSPDQGYNPPPPIVPLQMNTAAAPAPYRPPGMVTANPMVQAPPTNPSGPRGEGTKPRPGNL